MVELSHEEKKAYLLEHWDELDEADKRLLISVGVKK